MGLNPLAQQFVSAKVNKQPEVVLSRCTNINTPVPKAYTTTDLCPLVGLPLSNRFQALQDFVMETEAENTFDQSPFALHSNPANPASTNKRSRERNGRRNGERNESTQLAGESINTEGPTCAEYWLCKQQNGVDFGRVPLSPIKLFTGDPTYWETIPDIITAHKMIRHPGLPNFLGLRIPVNTHLKVEAWRYHLKDYWDQQLIDLIQYGFPLEKPARVFLNRMLQVLREQADKTIITLPPVFFKDLQWFNTFLTQYNGVTMYDIRPVTAEIFLDASLTGLGGVFGHQVYALALPKDFMGYNIVHLEMLNIVMALKVWSQNWANNRVHIFCDNRAVVDTLNFGRARDDILATCARNVWLLTAMFNITLITTHVYGTKNVIADLLSRWDKTADNVNKLAQHIQKPIWVDTHLDLTLLNYSI